MTRKVLIAFIFAFSLILPAKAQERVVFAFGSEGFLFLPYFVAVNKGYFLDEGIDAETVILRGGPVAMAAVMSGDAHVLGSGIHLSVQAQLAGQDVKAFGALVTEVTSQVVIQGEIARAAGIDESSSFEERLQVLNGLSIGITGPGSSTDRFTRSLIRAAGLEPDRDVTIVPLGSAAPVLASFQQKRIDGFFFSSPTAEVATLQMGGETLINLGTGEFEPLRGFLYNCLASRADWLEQNPDTARAILRAINSALRLIQESPEEAMDAARSYFTDLEPEIYEAAFAQSISAYPATARIEEEGVERNFVFIEESEGQRPALEPAAVYTNAYLDE